MTPSPIIPSLPLPLPPIPPKEQKSLTQTPPQLRSLKYVLLPDSSNATPAGSGMHTVARSQRNRRTQFLFIYSYVVQFIFMWILSRQDGSPAQIKTAAGAAKGVVGG